MEQITQLKQMRNDALARLQLNADYKLMISLDTLILEMNQLVQQTEKPKIAASVLPMLLKEKETASPSTTSKTTEEIEKAFEDIAGELDNEINNADIGQTIKSAMSTTDTSTTALRQNLA